MNSSPEWSTSPHFRRVLFGQLFFHVPGLSIAAALASVLDAFVGACEALAAATYEVWQR